MMTMTTMMMMMMLRSLRPRGSKEMGRVVRIKGRRAKTAKGRVRVKVRVRMVKGRAKIRAKEKGKEMACAGRLPQVIAPTEIDADLSTKHVLLNSLHAVDGRQCSSAHLSGDAIQFFVFLWLLCFFS